MGVVNKDMNHNRCPPCDGQHLLLRRRNPADTEVIRVVYSAAYRHKVIRHDVLPHYRWLRPGGKFNRNTLQPVQAQRRLQISYVRIMRRSSHHSTSTSTGS